MLRRQANEDLNNTVRESIRDAALCLAARDRVIPTLDSLVQETGLSAEQIQAYYPSMDDVAIEIRKVAEAMFLDLEEAMPSPGPLAQMLNELAELRARYYEAAADFKHLGDAGSHFLPSVAQATARRSVIYRESLCEMLEPHFQFTLNDVVAKIELITSWETWRHLRGVQRLTMEQAIEVMKSVLAAVASDAVQPLLAD